MGSEILIKQLLQLRSCLQAMVTMRSMDEIKYYKSLGEDYETTIEVSGSWG